MSSPKIGIPGQVPPPRTMLEDFRAKVENNGQLDKREVSELKKTWGRVPVTDSQAQELRENIRGWMNNVQPGKAREELQKFLERDLPKLTLDTRTGPREPAQRDFWSDLQLKATGDGRISKGDAKDLVKQWSSQLMTALQAQQLTQTLLDSTGSFESAGAIKVMQRFLQDDLPLLIKDRENLPPRSFDQDFRIALMDDGHLDRGDVGNLVDRFKREIYSPAHAHDLTESVLRNARYVDPGSARERMQHFLENDLPRQTSEGDGGAPPRRDHLQEARIKMLGDGKISDHEAETLTRQWNVPGATLAEAEAMRQASTRATYDPQAGNRLERFVDNNLPRLIVDQALSSPNTVTLAWDPPVENTDHTPLDNLAGYVIEYGQQPGVYDQEPLKIDDPSATQGTVDKLTPGTWYFAVRSRNTAGGVSPRSKVVPATIR